jgi:hypothetical protein
MIRAPIASLAELAGLGAAVLVGAVPERHRTALSRALHRLGDRPLARWPAAALLSVVGTGYAVRLAWHRRLVRRRQARDGRR